MAAILRARVRRAQTQRFLSLHGVVQNLFRVGRHLLRSANHPVYATSTDSKPKPDNTAVNKRDQNPGEATADQQKMNAADRALTAKIRKAVMADKNLSSYAHSVKIISQNGTVTLNGPVHSDDEVKSIMPMATEGAGSPDKV